ncbi:hypothetical protein HUT06_37490 [Actinomadura sp. NAK00032]|nr:hypothetical protein HUT06_37490 [Actinomadura sp. NAK00032]
MIQLATLVLDFAALLTPATGNDRKFTSGSATARSTALPHLHGFTNGLELDRAAVNAGPPLLHHNGRAEGVNTTPNDS